MLTSHRPAPDAIEVTRGRRGCIRRHESGSGCSGGTRAGAHPGAVSGSPPENVWFYRPRVRDAAREYGRAGRTRVVRRQVFRCWLGGDRNVVSSFFFCRCLRIGGVHGARGCPDAGAVSARTYHICSLRPKNGSERRVAPSFSAWRILCRIAGGALILFRTNFCDARGSRLPSRARCDCWFLQRVRGAGVRQHVGALSAGREVGERRRLLTQSHLFFFCFFFFAAIRWWCAPFDAAPYPKLIACDVAPSPRWHLDDLQVKL